MDVRLYVGNLPFNTNEDELRDLFGQAGEVVDVALIVDRETGRSKGFGFVSMASQDDADAAIRQFNGYTLANREIKVNVARPREETGGRSNFGSRRY